MKSFVFILFVVALFSSCSNDPREQIISDYEQTSGDTKTDLSLNVLEIIELGSVNAIDSLKILVPNFEAKKREHINFLMERIEEDKKSPAISSTNEMTIKIWEDGIKKYESDCKGTFLEEDYNRIKRLESDTSKILYNKVKVTYSIKNPFLNNVKQELTKVYMFTPDNKIILGVIE